MLFKNNKYSFFEVTEDDFTHEGFLHGFDEVKNLYFSHVHTTHYMAIIKVGESENLTFRIILSNNEKIELFVDKSTMHFGMNSNREKNINDLINIYLTFEQKTFSSRLQSYMKQIQENGYFIYDKCKFFPKNKIIIKNREFFIKNIILIKKPNCIELRSINEHALSKFIRDISIIGTPKFNIQIDTDVIFYLLDEYFGIKWN